MQKKRKSLRLPLAATAKIVNTNGAPLYACARNISRGGIGLYSCSPLDEDMDVSLEITFKDIRGNSKVETVDGRIEWQYKWNYIYVIGAKFNQLLDHEETPGLMEYIENCERLLYEE